MKTNDENIFGIRLKLARKMAGMSLQKLSDVLGTQVTKQALNKYELGKMKPSSEVLLALSKTLSLSPDYFLKKDLVEFKNVFFRKKSSLSVKDEDSIIEQSRDYLERLIELENLLGIHQPFVNPIKDNLIATLEDAEAAAEKLRQIWELGHNTIANVTKMLELKGIKVLLIKDTDAIDGLAVVSNSNTPLVVINTKGRNIERIRFTIIHELAHILLNFDKAVQADHKFVEKLCHYFSSCFLLPRKMIVKMIGGLKRDYISIKELIAIKNYFGISLRAIIYRLKQMNIITDTYYKRWTIYLTKTYGSKDEPGSFTGEEKTYLLESLIERALSEGIISYSKAAYLSKCSIDDIRKEFVSVK